MQGQSTNRQNDIIQKMQSQNKIQQPVRVMSIGNYGRTFDSTLSILPSFSYSSATNSIGLNKFIDPPITPTQLYETNTNEGLIASPFNEFFQKLQRQSTGQLMVFDSDTRDRLVSNEIKMQVFTPQNLIQQKTILNTIDRLSRDPTNRNRVPVITLVSPPKQANHIKKTKDSSTQPNKTMLEVPGIKQQPEDIDCKSQKLSASKQNSSQSEEAASENHHSKNARPDKNMKKIIFTPFKKLLHKETLKSDYGIDLSEYFRLCPNTKYGHRTWMDFEVVFWFVQQKYRNQPGAYQRYVKFMNDYRKQIDEYGKVSYDKPQDKQWLKTYKQYTESIYRAMNSIEDSQGRLKILYGKRCPANHAYDNLQKLKNNFFKAKILKSGEDNRGNI